MLVQADLGSNHPPASASKVGETTGASLPQSPAQKCTFPMSNQVILRHKNYCYGLMASLPVKRKKKKKLKPPAMYLGKLNFPLFLPLQIIQIAKFLPPQRNHNE
jgi:hypothetical protein